MTIPDEEFWEWAFEQGGRNPLAWQRSAKDLLDAADAVKARVYDFGGDGMHSLAAVQAMLIGMAIECLLKGMWIKSHEAWLEEDKEHGLTTNGELTRMRHHDLRKLADIAEVKVSKQEQAVLQRLSAFVTFGGRYPIPTKSSQMKPTETVSGETMARRFFSTAEFEVAERLAKRLMDEVLPWA